MLDNSMKILLVDDFDTTRKIIRNMLREINHDNIVEAKDGRTAFNILKKEEIALIISDWNMPNMTGFDLLKKVRSEPSVQDTPFIMVTAEAERDHILQAIKAKVSQYVIKPFTAEMLYKKIKAAMTEHS